MRLELGVFPVERAELTSATTVADGVLTVDGAALREHLLSDRRLRSVRIEVANPAESTRILHVLDAVEPRVKVAGPSRVFAGTLGAPITCGQGVTHALRGAAVVVCGAAPEPDVGVHLMQNGMIDMSGPLAESCCCSDTANVVVTIEPVDELGNQEFALAVRDAGTRAAAWVAECTRELEPPQREVYELTDSDEQLPRVVYIDQIRDQGWFVGTYLYGAHVTDMVPTLLHPNELLDGALVSGDYRGSLQVSTYLHQNNPLLLELYRAHGKSLHFAGVILTRGNHDSPELKQRSAQHAAKLAQLLRADGATITIEGFGNATLDFMLTVEACEQVGIKTVGVIHEPLVDSVPEARSLVSVGPGGLGGPGLPSEAPATTIGLGEGGQAAAGPGSPFCANWQRGIAGITGMDF